MARSNAEVHARKQPLFKDEIVEPHKESPNIRTGRFLWMETSDRKRYLSDLRNRIDRGFFFREEIVVKIVDDIAPVINDFVESDLGFG